MKTFAIIAVITIAVIAGSAYGIISALNNRDKDRRDGIDSITTTSTKIETVWVEKKIPRTKPAEAKTDTLVLVVSDSVALLSNASLKQWIADHLVKKTFVWFDDRVKVWIDYYPITDDYDGRIQHLDLNTVTENVKEAPLPIPEPPQHTAVNGDIAFAGKGIEGAVSLSLYAWGGASENDVIMRLPEIGISSNLRDSHSIFVGARYNIARHLPLFQNIYVSVKYGYSLGIQKTNVLVGLGVTL